MSEPRTIDRLIFVFAANSGLLSAAVDSAKKVLRLRGCSLCSITHGLAGEKREWSECREEIGVPVLQVHGTLDASIPIEAARALHARLRDARFVAVEGASHDVHVDAPDTLAREVADFVATLGP